jgi:hypothetical protein
MYFIGHDCCLVGIADGHRDVRVLCEFRNFWVINAKYASQSSAKMTVTKTACVWQIITPDRS